MTAIDRYVILIRGRVMPNNDENPEPLLCGSKAHALRVIRWLGLVGTKIVLATEEQIAEGTFCAAHARPGQF